MRRACVLAFLLAAAAAAQVVVDRPHSQQRALSGCGVAQWGHRQSGMGGS